FEQVRTRERSGYRAASSPLWPGEQTASIRVVGRAGRTFLVTDGLSDPYDPQMPTHFFEHELGCGCELFVEIAGELGDGEEQAAALHAYEWVLWCVADWEAEKGVVREWVEDYGVVMLEIAGHPSLESWQKANGQLEVAVGLAARDVLGSLALPAGRASLYSVKLLRPDERDHDVELATRGGRDLARRFARRGDFHLNWLARPSVLAEPAAELPAGIEAAWRDAPLPALVTPMPQELILFDPYLNETNAGVGVIGNRADDFIEQLYRQTGGAGAGELVPAAIRYLPLRLPAIAGFVMNIHLYGVRTDEGLESDVEQTALHTRALIIAHEGEDFPAGLQRAAELTSEPAVPTAICASPQVAQRFSELQGYAPVFAAELSEQAIVSSLKEIMRHVMIAIRDAGSQS
ncbi:MAG: hypothetical protein H0U74_14825, partial [Bradymonadaceae bacterium]|nr:hypothetical protein [Lujinxingiaceae bacterium]